MSTPMEEATPGFSSPGEKPKLTQKDIEDQHHKIMSKITPPGHDPLRISSPGGKPSDFEVGMHLAKEAEKKYNPDTATPAETRKEYNDKLSSLVGDCNEDLDEIDRQAGIDYMKKSLHESTERFNKAADDELEKAEQRQAEKIADIVVERLMGAVVAAIEGYRANADSSPGGEQHGTFAD